MTYYRNYSRRRGSSRRSYQSRYRRKSASAYSLAARSYALARANRLAFRPELKFHDVDSTNASLTSTQVTVALNAIGQGDDDTERVGRAIKLKYLYVKVTLEGTQNANSNTVRCALVWVAHADGALANANDIWEASSLNITTQRNTRQTHNFHMLWDKVYTLSPSTGKATLYFEKMFPLHYTTQYSGVSNNIADLSNGLLQFVAVSDRDGVAAPSATFNFRLRYTDA
jgi:hypothetical protein